jgi:hypothetical protein
MKNPHPKATDSEDSHRPIITSLRFDHNKIAESSGYRFSRNGEGCSDDEPSPSSQHKSSSRLKSTRIKNQCQGSIYYELEAN